MSLHIRPAASFLLLLLLGGCATAPESPADAAYGKYGSGQLLDGMGHHGYRVTTDVPEAQAFFDQGLVWYYGFAYDQAVRSFTRAAEIDPACAMAWWGVALGQGPVYNNATMNDARNRAAWEALQNALAAIDNESPTERALIRALSKRYADPPPEDRAGLDRAYAEAMAEVWNAHPDDADIGTLYAYAMMILTPWKLYDLDHTPAKNTPHIEATLERVMAMNPGNPGANHLYIHAVEASATPERALEPGAIGDLDAGDADIEQVGGRTPVRHAGEPFDAEPHPGAARVPEDADIVFRIRRLVADGVADPAGLKAGDRFEPTAFGNALTRETDLTLLRPDRGRKPRDHEAFLSGIADHVEDLAASADRLGASPAVGSDLDPQRAADLELLPDFARQGRGLRFSAGNIENDIQGGVVPEREADVSDNDSVLEMDRTAVSHEPLGSRVEDVADRIADQCRGRAVEDEPQSRRANHGVGFEQPDRLRQALQQLLVRFPPRERIEKSRRDAVTRHVERGPRQSQLRSAGQSDDSVLGPDHFGAEFASMIARAFVGVALQPDLVFDPLHADLLELLGQVGPLHGRRLDGVVPEDVVCRIPGADVGSGAVPRCSPSPPGRDRRDRSETKDDGEDRAFSSRLHGAHRNDWGAGSKPNRVVPAAETPLEFIDQAPGDLADLARRLGIAGDLLERLLRKTEPRFVIDPSSQFAEGRALRA